MRKIGMPGWVLGMLCATLLFAGQGAADEVKMMSVQVKEAQLRDAPSFLGKLLVKLPYATTVETFAEQDGWMQVRVTENQQEGWMHASALTKKVLNLIQESANLGVSAQGQNAVLAGKAKKADNETALAGKTLAGKNQATAPDVSADEISIAGKGLSDVEQEYQASHAGLDYATVIKMETVAIPQAEMQKFLKDGNVVVPVGGVQ